MHQIAAVGLPQLPLLRWRGKAVGGMTSIGFLGQFFSPIFTQPFVEQIGLPAMFGVAASIALLLAIVFAVSVARVRTDNRIYDRK